MSYYPNRLTLSDGPQLDAFSRLRVSSPIAAFDAQFTYGLQSLLFERLTNGVGAVIAHDSTNRRANFSFTATTTGGYAYMQSYDWHRYHPGRSQLIFLTGCFNAHTANVVKLLGYSDGNNGVEFQSNGTGFQWVLYSTTAVGNQTVAQTAWNLDKLDGTGRSGATLDVADIQICVIDLQALYAGRVRVGFDIGGSVVYCHEFNHANVVSSPYVQTASLPIRAGMRCTGTVTASMNFVCCSVIVEGGQPDDEGCHFTTEGTVTAGSGARTHILSLRPKTTIGGLANRGRFILESVSLLVTGTNPVLWELAIGQGISGTTAFNDVNTTYSAMEYNTLGTISGSPTIVADSGYVSASNQVKVVVSPLMETHYPITLDAAGAVRSLGTISILVTGIGGSSTCRCSLGWVEVR